jgi:hypothetical protein
MCSLIGTTLPKRAPCHLEPRVRMEAETRAGDDGGEGVDEAEAGRRLRNLCHLLARWGMAKSSPLPRLNHQALRR